MVLAWDVGAASGSAVMTGGPTFLAQVGPFGEGALALSETSAPVTLTVTATDAVGNTSETVVSSESILKIINCGTGGPP